MRPVYPVTPRLLCGDIYEDTVFNCKDCVVVALSKVRLLMKFIWVDVVFLSRLVLSDHASFLLSDY